ncbi:syntaxin-11-like [Xiphophorus couchianus]|uniref:syntaxin-11-like n=1 Tax=Xiphophorus couchianus TaxID=32473 RepID=UPI0010161A54|nr:syntaxin-11-like [Xiphophorus couchianus]
MRDRLGHLQEAQTDPEGFSAVDLNGRSEHEDSNPDLDGILQQAQRIRLEIQQIQNNIGELKEVNFQTLNKTSFPDVTKRDSNAIGMDIKRGGEAVLQQLHGMNDLRGQLEDQRGSSDPVARVARTQYRYLSAALREVMFSYNEAEMSHSEACKRHIQRQMEVAGREVSETELEEMMEGEEPQVFSIQVGGQTARSALVSIESRQRELQELEKRIQGIQELFLDVAMLVQEQGAGVEIIERNVQNAEVTVQEGTFQLERALASDKNNPFKKMFCGCFPCYKKLP